MMAQYQSVNDSSMLLSSQAIQSTGSHAVLEHSIYLMKVMKAALKDEVEAPQTPLLGLKDITKIEQMKIKRLVFINLRVFVNHIFNITIIFL